MKIECRNLYKNIYPLDDSKIKDICYLGDIKRFKSFYTAYNFGLAVPLVFTRFKISNNYLFQLIENLHDI